MTIKRLPRYPKPYNLETLEDIKAYIKNLHEALEQEGNLRLRDFEEATGLTDHGGLPGLSDDDHPQYLLANGTRNLTGYTATLGAASVITKDPVFDIRAYGATGGADDSTAFRAACTAAAAAEGAVYVPPNTYIIAPDTNGHCATLGAGVSLIGDGWNSQLKLKDDSDTAVSMINLTAGRNYVGHIMLDGNRTNNPIGAHGIHVGGTGWQSYIDHVMIDEFRGTGIYIPNTATSGGWGFHQVRVRNSNRGYHIAGGYDNKFSLCVALWCDDWGMLLGSGVTGTQLIGCRPNACGTIDNPNTGNLRVMANANVIASGCLLDNANGIGVLLEGSGSIFSGCVVHSAGQFSTAGNYPGVRIVGNHNCFTGCQFRYNYEGSGVRVESIGNAFTGCNFRANGSKGTTETYYDGSPARAHAGYGLEFSGTYTGNNNVVIGNTFASNVTGKYNVATGTYIDHNRLA